MLSFAELNSIEDDDAEIGTMMRIRRGRHLGKAVESIFLKSPDWAQWVVMNYPNWDLAEAFRKLRQRFDAKPLSRKCASCGAPAACATAYRGTATGLRFWCRHHAPTHDNRLTVIEGFSDAMWHVDSTCTARMADKRTIVAALARAKGLPRRVGEVEAIKFFAQ